MRASVETLKNGLRLALIPEVEAQSVNLGIFVDSGSRHEKSRDAGISHFIEHMLFKGTKTRSALQISQAIEGCGGNFNAWTNEETTCFYARMPFEHIETAVDVLCDMYVNAAVPDTEFERERNVVIEELHMYDDEPDAVASENLSRLLFPGNALGLPVGGNEPVLKKLTAARLREYIRKAYVPKATIVVLNGRFDPEVARRLLVPRLERIAPRRPLKIVPVDFSKPVMPEMRVERDINQVQLALGWRIPFGETDPRRQIVTVFDSLMGRSMSSRLFQSIREKRGLSYDIHSNLQFFVDVGGWTITAGLDAKRPQEALKAIETEVDKIRTKKPSIAELERTKDYIIGNMRLGFESPRNRLFYWAGGLSSYNRLVEMDEIVEKIRSVTRDDVLSIAQTVLDDSQRSISWVVPKASR